MPTPSPLGKVAAVVRRLPDAAHRLVVGGQGRALAGLLLAAVMAVAVIEPRWLVSLQEQVFDLYQQWRPRQPTREHVAFVDIDEASFARFGQWPWPRWRLAELIDRIDAAGPRAIGLDMLLIEPDRLSPENLARSLEREDPQLVARLQTLPSHDARLAETLMRSDVVLAQVALDRGGATWDSSLRTPVEGEELGQALPGFSGMLTSLPILGEAALGHGVINTAHSPGETVREVPLVVRVGDLVVPSLSFDLVRIGVGANWISLQGDAGRLSAVELEGLPKPVAIGADGTLRPHYATDSGRPLVLAHALLENGDVAGQLRDRYVLVSVSALGTIDNHPIPLGWAIPGVEIHGEVIENILDGTWLEVPRWAWPTSLLVLAVGGLLLIWLVPHVGPARSVAPLLAILLVAFAGSLALFARQRLLVDPAVPVAGVTLVFLSLLGSRYLIVAAALRRELLASERMSGELDAARRIQMGILPDPAAIAGLPSHVDIAARILPAREVGGDFFDAFMLDERRLFFVLGDVSGKGVPAALFMAVSKSLCRSIAMRSEPAPGAILVAAQAEIARENATSLLVTAVAGVLDTATGELALSSAGHPKPLLVGVGRPAKPCAVATAPPLCARSGTTYRSSRVRLEPGDRLLVVSDGVLDALSERLSLAQQQLAAIADTTSAGSAAALVERVLERVRAGQRATATPADDVTVLALSWRRPAGSVSGC